MGFLTKLPKTQITTFPTFLLTTILILTAKAVLKAIMSWAFTALKTQAQFPRSRIEREWFAPKPMIVAIIIIQAKVWIVAFEILGKNFSGFHGDLIND